MAFELRRVHNPYSFDRMQSNFARLFHILFKKRNTSSISDFFSFQATAHAEPSLRFFGFLFCFSSYVFYIFYFMLCYHTHISQWSSRIAVGCTLLRNRNRGSLQKVLLCIQNLFSIWDIQYSFQLCELCSGREVLCETQHHLSEYIPSFQSKKCFPFYGEIEIVFRRDET